MRRGSGAEDRTVSELLRPRAVTERGESRRISPVELSLGADRLEIEARSVSSLEGWGGVNLSPL